MKIRVNIDCTPEEARAFLGMPDVRPLNEAMVRSLEDRMGTALDRLDPEALMRLWMPGGVEAAEAMQKMFWSRVGGGTGRKG